MRNMIATVATTVLLASGATLATASSSAAAPASASATTYCQDAALWDHVWTTTDSAKGGTVCIAEYGDIVYLCDTAADGLAPRVDISTQSSSGQYNTRYSLTASGGNGTCVHARASDGGSHDLPEEDNIGVDIWLGPAPGSFPSSHSFLNNG